MCLLLKPQTSSSVVDSSRIDAMATTGEVTITTTSTVDKCCVAVYKFNFTEVTYNSYY